MAKRFLLPVLLFLASGAAAEMRIVRLRIVDGVIPQPATLVEVRYPETDMAAERVERVFTNADGFVTLQVRTPSVSIRVPSLSSEARAVEVDPFRAMTQHQLAPRTWVATNGQPGEPAPSAAAPPGGAQEITFTVDCWDNAFNQGNGNNCDFCSGVIGFGEPFTYNCNEGTQNAWTPSCSFNSPVPATATVTDFQAVVIMKDCSGQRAYPSSTYNVLLNNASFASPRSSSLNNCGCNSTPGCLQEPFNSATFPDGVPGYVNGSTNTVTIEVSSGAICVEKMLVTLKYKTDFRIELPTDGVLLPFGFPDYRSRTVQYQAVGQPVSSNGNDKVKWTTHLEFSDGPVANFTQDDNFQNFLGATKTRDFNGVGGKLTVTATRLNDVTSSVAYITGAEIPDPTITAKLLQIYNGPTPNLMTGIAFTESSYRQFNDETLYGQAAKWPYRTGSFVGLMQIPGTMDRMWDWHVNVEWAENFFSADKAQIARSRERFYTNNNSAYPGLPQLNALQREDNTLWFYGPCSVHGDRFTPVLISGNWTWRVDPTNRQQCINDIGYDYVDRVRANLR